MIAIADYGMGNLRSVSKALLYIGAEVSVTDSADEILKADALVVPGVGAFGGCIKNLKKLGLIDIIKKFIGSGRPYLGLCLGMQILFETSEEAKGVPGLSIFSGTVNKFPASLGLKIPHMGWNTVTPSNDYMYFVHSYYVAPKDKSIIAGETEYGIKFCSIIKKDNIWATQFHPEKSQKKGLEFLNNFIELCR